MGLRRPMAWLRLVGSLQLQVSFAKAPYKTDDILQKKPILKEPNNRSRPMRFIFNRSCIFHKT